MSEVNKENKEFTFENEQYRKTYWHTCSHILAQAVKRLHPEVKLAIGPSIDNGFYYDLDAPFAFTQDDLGEIEAEMRKICKEKLKLERFELNVYGKEDTLVTIQIDMLLAERFGMYYIDENGNKALPYIIHRTSLGCYERTLAYLIEEYAGALPTWMMPEQVRFLPITDRAADYCVQQAAELRKQGFRVEVDSRNEKIGKKIREATLEKIPFMLVVGDRDMENGTVSVRTRKGEDLGAMTLEDFSAKLRRIVDEKQKI